MQSVQLTCFVNIQQREAENNQGRIIPGTTNFWHICFWLANTHVHKIDRWNYEVIWNQHGSSELRVTCVCNLADDSGSQQEDAKKITLSILKSYLRLKTVSFHKSNVSYCWVHSWLQCTFAYQKVVHIFKHCRLFRCFKLKRWHQIILNSSNS